MKTTADRSSGVTKQACGHLAGMLLLAHLAAPWCLAQNAKKTSEEGAAPPGVEVRIHAEPEKATIGDPIRIDFDIALPQGYEVRLPNLGTSEGDFSILQVFPGPTVPEPAPASGQPPAKASGTPVQPGHYRARIVAAVYKTGEVTFPSLQLTLRDPSGRETPLPSPPVKVQIQSVLTDKDQTLKDLKKQAEIPEPSRWLLWAALGLLALLMAGLVWWLYRRRARRAAVPYSGPQLDPLELAEAELRDLAARGLLEKRMVKQFYVALSDIVKRVLEAGYDIVAVEKTTDEILEGLRAQDSPPVAREELDCVALFLGACDLVKFAKFTPSQTENEDSVKSAYRVLALARNRRAARAVPVAARAGGGT